MAPFEPVAGPFAQEEEEVRTKQFHQPHLKMYILVRKRAPVGVGTVNAAHVAVMAVLKFKNDPDTKKWLNPGPFYKVVVSVTDKQWKAAKRVPGHVLIKEDRWGDREVAMAFKPRLNWPKAFSEFPLFPGAKSNPKQRVRCNREHVEKFHPSMYGGRDTLVGPPGGWID